MAKFMTPGEVREYITGGITYHLRAPSVADRVAYEREAVASGARYWNEIERIAVMRKGVLEIMPEDDADRRSILEMIDGAVLDLYTASESLASGRDDPEMLELWVAALSRLQAIGDEVQRGYPEYARVVADNAVYRSLRGISAAKLFLMEWDGIGEPLVRGRNCVLQECLDMIPYDHFAGIGLFVDNMMRPTEAEVKNSESRQPGERAAKPLEGQKTPRRKAR